MNTEVRLTLRPFMWSHDGPNIDPNARTCGYWVDGMPKGFLAQIVNTQPASHEPVWYFRYIGQKAELGDYKTEQVALAALQSFADDPAELLDAHYKAEAAWCEKWGNTPDHFLAKKTHQEVEAWERIIKAHQESSVRFLVADAVQYRWSRR